MILVFNFRPAVQTINFLTLQIMKATSFYHFMSQQFHSLEKFDAAVKVRIHFNKSVEVSSGVLS